MMRKQGLVVLVGLLSLASVLRGAGLLGGALGNLGTIGLRNALLLETLPMDTGRWPWVYSLHGALHKSDAESQLVLLRRAVVLHFTY